MSSFTCEAREITVEEHPNASALEIGRVDGYQFIIKKGDFKTGDWGIYIPEQSVLPPLLIEEMGLVGRLSGAGKNRVKAIKLRGVLSQGLFYRPKLLPGIPTPNWWLDDYPAMCVLGDGDYPKGDLSVMLGIKKWQPPIPRELIGRVRPIGDNAFTHNYDIENCKTYNKVLLEGELVAYTEKLHGTQCVVGVYKQTQEYDAPVEYYVTSKGLNARRLTIEPDDNNAYWRVTNELDLVKKLTDLLDEFNDQYRGSDRIRGLILYGEVIGVQDLMYGLEKGQLAFRAFDLYCEDWEGDSKFLDYNYFAKRMGGLGIPLVPALAIEPFNKIRLAAITSGLTCDKDNPNSNIREGVVVKPVIERTDQALGRVILKSVSSEYLTRGGVTTEAD